MKKENESSEWMKWIHTIPYKEYSRFVGLDLEWTNPTNEIEQYCITRSSVREPSDVVINLKDLTRILRFSSGRRDSEEEHRCYPSAGARYPLELYLFVYEVDGLEGGIYHYSVLKHAITRLWDAPSREVVHELWGAEDPNLHDVKILVIFTAVSDRTTFKYGDLGQHFPWIECGYLGALILAHCHTINLNAVPMGIQWSAEAFGNLLDLHEDEKVFHSIAIM